MVALTFSTPHCSHSFDFFNVASSPAPPPAAAGAAATAAAAGVGVASGAVGGAGRVARDAGTGGGGPASGAGGCTRAAGIGGAAAAVVAAADGGCGPTVSERGFLSVDDLSLLSLALSFELVLVRALTPVGGVGRATTGDGGATGC